MSLRRKILVVVGGTLFCLLALLYGASRTIILNGFTSLEVEQVLRNLERVQNVIDDDLASLSMTGQDWAYWDDTYAYALGEAPEYEEANLYDSIFFDYHINVALFTDRDGQIIFGNGYDLETSERMELPASLLHHLEPDDPLMVGLHAEDRESASATQGILHLQEGPLLFVALPILRSDGTGPAAGVMLWGRFLDNLAVERLSKLVELPLSIYTIDDPRMPLDVLSVHRQLRTSTPTMTQVLDGETIAGYSLLRDIENAPAAIARIEVPRSIYQSGESTMSYYLVSFVVVGLVFIGVILLLLNRMVLARLERLSDSVNAITSASSKGERVVVDGSDELAALATRVNEMLAALERSQDELQAANQLLEKRVNERTAQLSLANQQLRQEIEERERAQQELALARDQALEALRVKTQILANVSHDSRTPLNAITGYAEMMLGGVYGTLTEQQQNAVKRIMSNAQDLLVFINNLLDSAKLEVNAIKPLYRLFDLNNLLAAVESTIALRAGQKQLEFITLVDSHLPKQIYSDEQRIKQIITNLLVNAIKFTDQGSITLRVFRHDDTHWGFAVRDTGKGIAPEVQERIFEAFWQVDGSPTRRNNSGVGLGLAIVQALVRLLEGTIKVESEVEQGSTFTVILPLLSEQREKVV